eukprot:TRINITY_DN25898_c0_g2_i1.p1 TRINITY_DN25898_c0_g2~~TRINITY_DN25898_c0_g2_i1.p1  ORF type:complete len:188 (-),score=4.87 TRINITY_DN25898_c0_g2_i1:113-676(-)
MLSNVLGSPKVCRIQELKVGLWEPCFDSALFHFNCKDDLQCGRDLLGKGVKLCRPKRGIGDVCENDDSCVGHLKCDPSYKQEPFQRRCFDPSLALHIGSSCNLNPGPEEPRCVAVVETDPTFQFITGNFALECLPKNGKNVCQRPAYLFQQCSMEENNACASRDLGCSAFNVCVPISQFVREHSRSY